jgi:hypothetical protein
LGARTQSQLAPFERRLGWALDDEAKRAIDATLAAKVTNPVGPEFMAPPERKAA